MRRIFVLLLLSAVLAPTAASAATPIPDPLAASCHGRAMGIGASLWHGTATYARSVDISVIDAHFAFMGEYDCPE